MSKDTMNQYALQSYFESVCKSFYIAYEQVKRLEKEREEIEKIALHEDQQKIEELTFEISVLEEQLQNFTQRYSKEELKEKEEQLVILRREYAKVCDRVNKNMYWDNLLRGKTVEIWDILKSMYRNGFKVIVTKKEEIFPLISFFRSWSLETYRIINIEETHLKSFPAGHKMYEEFLAAYCQKDETKMEEIYEEYF